MNNVASRLQNVLLWIGTFMLLFTVWEMSVSPLLTALEWLSVNPAWIPPVSLYLACVIVKSYVVFQSVPLMTKAMVRYAGLKPDARRDSASMILACVMWSALILVFVIPALIEERSRFWRCRPRREIVEATRQDTWAMRYLKRMGKRELTREF